MTLVDTSVWIDFFAGRDSQQVIKLEQLILDNDNLAINGIILSEILQGISNNKTYQKVLNYIDALLMLEMSRPVFIEAANIYRKLRKKGITVRKTNDCIIAATALSYDCILLHNDKDFAAIQSEFPLLTA